MMDRKTKQLVTLTFILGFYFDLWIFVDLFGEFSTDIAKVWHWNACIIEPFLCLLQLIVGELQLSEQVSYALSESSSREKVTGQYELLTVR